MILLLSIVLIAFWGISYFAVKLSIHNDVTRRLLEQEEWRQAGIKLRSKK